MLADARPRGVRAWGCSTACPQTMQALDDLPRASAPASATTTTATARRARSASSAASSRGTGRHLLPDVLPALDGVVDKPRRRLRRRRRRLRRRRRGAADGRRVPRQPRSPATTSRSTRSPGPTSGRAEAGCTNAAFHDPRQHAAARRRLARPRHDVRLHPRHDPPAGDDATPSARASPTTARGCSSTSRRSTRSPRTSTKNPMASLMYGISVLSCMSSALSAPGGAGLGTLGHVRGRRSRRDSAHPPPASAHRLRPPPRSTTPPTRLRYASICAYQPAPSRTRVGGERSAEPVGPWTMTLSPARYRTITFAALFLLGAIIVTGAAVRLTGSGLGCDDWPRCSSTRVVDVSSKHAAIEQVNRLFTGLVSVGGHRRGARLDPSGAAPEGPPVPLARTRRRGGRPDRARRDHRPGRPAPPRGPGPHARVARPRGERRRARPSRRPARRRRRDAPGVP